MSPIPSLTPRSTAPVTDTVTGLSSETSYTFMLRVARHRGAPRDLQRHISSVH